MNNYYLRVEGVNLDAVLSDTNQLSVIRGGSLLLRKAIKLIAKYFSHQLQPISSGASVGLFEFTASDDQAAAELCQQVANRLNLHTRLQHLTFVVDIQAASDHFLDDKEAVLARNRFHQMQQLTIAVPPKNTEKSKGSCEIDNLRPAFKTEPVQGEEKAVSQSASERLNYGREQKKQQFYYEETGLKLAFTQDFHELAQRDTDKFDNLNNKIAVLYFDGNGFSGIQARHCQTIEAMRNFDNDIQEKRREFLRSLLNEIKKDEAFLTPDNKLRLETLLWGGDEMIFVVPAWQGLKLLNTFYTDSQNWKFSTERLTHAGGIVFCQVGTPIQRVVKLAKDLADAVKAYPQGRNQNGFDYAVLESIAYPTESLETFYKQRFGEELSKNRQPLMPFDNAAVERVKRLQEIVPKSQAYAVVRAILQESQGVEGAVTKQLTRLEEVIEQPLESIEADLEQIFPQHTSYWQWLHLVELWDYWGFEQDFEDVKGGPD